MPTEALSYFLDPELPPAEMDFPDRGIDYAFMMNASDWQSLSAVWSDYSAEWKHAITYFAGFSILEDSVAVFNCALPEADDSWMPEILFALYETVVNEWDSDINGPEVNNTFHRLIPAVHLNKCLKFLHANETLRNTHAELKHLFEILSLENVRD